MKISKLIGTVVISAFIQPVFASEYKLLEGDERTACEVILCLASGQRPSECIPPLQRYFSIVRSKPWKTIRDRFNFLKLCPVNSSGGTMPDGDIRLLSELGGKCSDEGKQNYILGQGSTYESGDGNITQCRWNLRHNRFTSPSGENCSGSNIPLSTRIQNAENMCKPLYDKFRVPDEIAVQYISVKKCQAFAGNKESNGPYLECTESLFLSTDPTIPQPRTMPASCYGSSISKNSNCYSIEVI